MFGKMSIYSRKVTPLHRLDKLQASGGMLPKPLPPVNCVFSQKSFAVLFKF
jgi:hypothetical protein